MNKFKKVMLGALSVLTLGLFAVVGTKVNAATTYSYGEATVTTTSYTGDTKTWDFSKNLPSSNVQIPVGDNLLGIVSSNDGTDGKDTQVIAIKSKASNGYDTYQGAEFLIPVPSATSSGTVSRTGNTTGGRYIALGSQTAKALASPLNFTFSKDDIETNPTLSDDSTVTGYYLRFTVSGGEAKNYSFSVTLTDGTSAYSGAVATYDISYNLDGGTNPSNAPTSAADGSVVTLPIPTKTGCTFAGWTLDGGDSTILTTYTMNGSNVFFTAHWEESSYGTQKTLLVSDLGMSNDTSSNGIVNGTIFATYSATVKSESKNGYTQTYKLDQLKSVTVTSGKVVPNRMIAIHVTSEYGATINVYTRSTDSSTARTMNVCNDAGTIVSTNLSALGTGYEKTLFYVESAGDFYLYASSGNVFIAEISVEYNTNIRVMQQEATGQTIGENAATYIRFVAIIKDEDVNSSDFTFKIYRTKDDTTEYITRSVSTYSSLKLNGNDYSVKLPSGVSAHTFNGNNGNEVYAVYVVGFTNSTYSGYTVSAGFTYKGTEYKTSGYTFA